MSSIVVITQRKKGHVHTRVCSCPFRSFCGRARRLRMTVGHQGPEIFVELQRVTRERCGNNTSRCLEVDGRVLVSGVVPPFGDFGCQTPTTTVDVLEFNPVRIGRLDSCRRRAGVVREGVGDRVECQVPPGTSNVTAVPQLSPIAEEVLGDVVRAVGKRVDPRLVGGVVHGAFHRKRPIRVPDDPERKGACAGVDHLTVLECRLHCEGDISRSGGILAAVRRLCSHFRVDRATLPERQVCRRGRFDRVSDPGESAGDTGATASNRRRGALEGGCRPEREVDDHLGAGFDVSRPVYRSDGRDRDGGVGSVPTTATTPTASSEEHGCHEDSQARRETGASASEGGEEHGDLHGDLPYLSITGLMSNNRSLPRLSIQRAHYLSKSLLLQ